MAEAIRVLETVSTASSDVELKLESYDFGGCSVDKHGIPMTDETLQACQQADAILLGTLLQTTCRFTLLTQTNRCYRRTEMGRKRQGPP